MSKPEVSRRDENGDRAVIIHAYAPGDGDLSFVAATSAHPHRAISPGPTREECAAACPEGWKLYQEGSVWRARKSATQSPDAPPVSLPPTFKREDFSFQATAEGYTIQYKGHTIGGTGIIGKFKGRGRPPRGFASRAMQQAQEYKTNAQSVIRSLIMGNGPGHMLSSIVKIDADENGKRTA